MECVNFVVSLLQEPVAKAIGYVLRVGANVRALKKASVELQLKKAEVNRRIEAATVATDEEKPTERVNEWLEEVAAIEVEVAEIEKDYGQRTTFIGDCLLNCWSGYRIGRRAFQVTEEVKEVGVRGDFVAVTERTVPVVEWRPIMPDAPAVEPYLEKVRSYLHNNEVVTVGIWGMGGVGKTFLLHKIHSDPYIASAGFDYVIWAVVSQEPDLRKLQGDIADRLDLPLPKGDAGSRAEKIQRFLEKKKFLLLLDDLWNSLDLDILGVPRPRQGDSGGANCKQKVVFTTRSEAVCMRMQASMKVQLECLEWEAAWHLFEENLGEIATIINSDKMVRIRAVRVAEKCGGLPLALKVVGKAMSFRRTWREWEDAIDMLDRLQLPEMWGNADDPFPLLKFSYDYLPDDRTRRCFLCCSLSPEDYEFPKDDLILCWMGQGLLDGFGDFRHAYNKGHTLIENLKQACLLEQDVNGPNGQIYIKMHDVIRGLALWIASECGANEKKWMVAAGFGLEEAPDEAEKWGEAEKISLMSCNIGTLLPQQPHCPNLSTLMLQFNRNLCIPDAFFKNMPALTYLDLAYVPSFPTEFDKLVRLRYLDLSGTNIVSLPEGLGSLTGLEYLLLRHTRSLETIPHGLMSRLEKLKLLDLTGSRYMKLEGAADALVEELECSRVGGTKTLAATIITSPDLQRLSGSSRVSLWKLSIVELEDVTSLQLSQPLLQTRGTRRSLQELEISNCRSLEELVMSGGNVEGEYGLENLEVLMLYNLVKLQKITWGGVLSSVLFCNLRFLTLHYCLELKNVTWIQQLQHLVDLSVLSCRKMEEVIGDAGDVPQGASEIKEEEGPIRISAFPNLKSLSLLNLPRLEVFCSHSLAFPSLEAFKLYCPKLKKLPFSSEITTNKFRKIEIQGTWDWWEGLVWEEHGIKSFLEPYLKVIGYSG